jgi:non-canonical poly(A) RNA polymerase PAPD5/7
VPTFSLQVLAKARVPIVKFEETESAHAFDVSFDVAGGPDATLAVRRLMDELPPMRPLVVILKVLLQQRDLNEVYSGGLGSYALLVMVASFLQTHPSRHGDGRRPGTLEPNLGVLLLDFLRLYGRSLGHINVGVSCRRGGHFYNKRHRDFYSEERPFLLSVEDPRDPQNDLGRSSYNIFRVRAAFEHVYCRLLEPSDKGHSVLSRIVRLDPALFSRGVPPPLPALDSAAAAVAAAAADSMDEKEERKGRVDKVKREEKRGGASKKTGRANRGSGSGDRIEKRRHRERSASDDDFSAPGPGSRKEAPLKEESHDGRGDTKRRRVTEGDPEEHSDRQRQQQHREMKQQNRHNWKRNVGDGRGGGSNSGGGNGKPRRKGRDRSHDDVHVGRGRGKNGRGGARGGRGWSQYSGQGTGSRSQHLRFE